MTASPPPPASPAGPLARLARALRALVATWRGRFILAFLVVQALAPLHYYTVRRDVHDERFAWRMFSPMRMTQCRWAVSIDKQPITLGTQFHEAWLEMVGRGRMTVIEQMAAKLCRANLGKPVEVTLDCTYIDRPPARFGGFDVCTRPLL